MPRLEAVTYPVGDLKKLVGLTDIQSPLPGEIARNVVDHLSGSWRHDHNPRREKYRFRNGMRHKNDRFACLSPEVQELLIEVISGDFVQRPKGLIHQQQLGFDAERPGDGRENGDLRARSAEAKFGVDRRPGDGGVNGDLRGHTYLDIYVCENQPVLP